MNALMAGATPGWPAPRSPTARVLAVADAYDAITRVSGYRQPRTPTEAVDELRRHARSQFDAAAVDAIAAWVAASEQPTAGQHVTQKRGGDPPICARVRGLRATLAAEPP